MLWFGAFVAQKIPWMRSRWGIHHGCISLTMPVVSRSDSRRLSRQYLVDTLIVIVLFWLYCPASVRRLLEGPPFATAAVLEPSRTRTACISIYTQGHSRTICWADWLPASPWRLLTYSLALFLSIYVALVWCWSNRAIDWRRKIGFALTVLDGPLTPEGLTPNVQNPQLLSPMGLDLAIVKRALIGPLKIPLNQVTQAARMGPEDGLRASLGPRGLALRVARGSIGGSTFWDTVQIILLCLWASPSVN